MEITLDVTLILFGLVLNGARQNGRRNVLTGDDPEKVSNVQKAKQDQELKGRAGKGNADMTVLTL